ncbi:hypothetical protein K450DRAFT_288174 [Umbelopsis ramanniana AG]|uniref:galacturonan 1,4-alpha-galacturonidase n=1 Tax=Umbelopsis ramanniana AG TaxID=1314678 RepID=A0AAD5E9P7_UMBRA|nr:uncharacterized protein K450DRAFT_288174 [Umbelopsis ramanniana AG]KAI8579474.1 hypothetical protein K450DRAFT_288174 [Umbelopsis ramanniana AG]
MLFKAWSSLVVAVASLSVASALRHHHYPQRPPYTRGHGKTCTLTPKGHGADDAPNILAAAHKCNNGGKVVLPAGKNFTIGSPLDLTFLKNVDLEFAGRITFTNDTDFWQNNSYYLTYQNASTFWLIGGENTNIYGGGVIDGNGQPWYDLYAKNPLVLRPILFVIYGARGGSAKDLSLINSPQWFNFIANSSDFVYDGLHIAGKSVSSNVAKNTDGWDIYRSDGITITNSVIYNGDDCVSFKPNSTNIYVSNLYCNGSHGISVGSLGQYPAEYDIVENVYSYNISMNYASDGARVKVWPGNAAAMSTDLQGGGGAGYVKNITFDTFYLNSVDYAIELTQCYGQNNASLCVQAPSKMKLTDINFNNFYGTTSGVRKAVVATIICSVESMCSNIEASNINVTSPAKYGTSQYICTRVDTSDLHIPCTSS